MCCNYLSCPHDFFLYVHAICNLHSQQNIPLMGLLLLGEMLLVLLRGVGLPEGTPQASLWPFPLQDLMLWSLLQSSSNLDTLKICAQLSGLTPVGELWPETYLLWSFIHICRDKSQQGNYIIRIQLTNIDFQQYKYSVCLPGPGICSPTLILCQSISEMVHPMILWTKTIGNCVPCRGHQNHKVQLDAIHQYLFLKLLCKFNQVNTWFQIRQVILVCKLLADTAAQSQWSVPITVTITNLLSEPGFGSLRCYKNKKLQI